MVAASARVIRSRLDAGWDSSTYVEKSSKAEMGVSRGMFVMPSEACDGFLTVSIESHDMLKRRIARQTA